MPALHEVLLPSWLLSSPAPPSPALPLAGVQWTARACHAEIYVFCVFLFVGAPFAGLRRCGRPPQRAAHGRHAAGSGAQDGCNPVHHSHLRYKVQLGRAAQRGAECGRSSRLQRWQQGSRPGCGACFCSTVLTAPAVHCACCLLTTATTVPLSVATAACAAAGDAEQAFAQYAQMKADGVAADKMVYATVIKACAETIDRLPPSERCVACLPACPADGEWDGRQRQGGYMPCFWIQHTPVHSTCDSTLPPCSLTQPYPTPTSHQRMCRRQRLVLLERAFALVDDAKAARVPTDAAVWNVLVTASGRAGQLQRAFNVLEDMLASGARPNDRTYASVMDACGRAGDLALALRIYRKAQREGCGRSLMIYSAAVHACLHARGGCDSAEAMNIYADMQR